jgi:ABC-type sugar transport system substrate-binding protein
MGFDFARRRTLAAAGMCAAALALGACGSSSGSSTSSSAASAGSSSTAGGSTNAGSTSAFPTAAAGNAKFEQRPTSIGITTPVGKKIPKGKVVDFIQCGVPACAVEGDILQSATNLLGWTLKRINAGTSPEQIANAYQQAVNNKPDAVVGSGYPRALFNSELSKLAAMHVPVLEAFVADSPGNGLTGIVGGNTLNTIQGKEVADYILSNSSDKSMTIGAVVPPGFPNMVVEQRSLTSTVKQQCPSCSVKLLSPPVTSIGADLPQRVTSFLQANPSIKWAWEGYDDMVTGLPTALKGASITGAKITTISMNGTVAAYIKQHNFVQSAIGTSFPEVYWREIDLLARDFTGQPYTVDTNDATLPYWTITASNLPSNAGSTTFANVVDYKQQFQKLWGVG